MTHDAGCHHSTDLAAVRVDMREIKLALADLRIAVNHIVVKVGTLQQGQTIMASELINLINQVNDFSNDVSTGLRRAGNELELLGNEVREIVNKLNEQEQDDPDVNSAVGMLTSISDRLNTARADVTRHADSLAQLAADAKAPIPTGQPTPAPSPTPGAGV